METLKRDVQHPRYHLHSFLGKGASGQVVLAKDGQTDRPVAIKLLERGPQVNDYTDREAFTHRLLNHPHVVKMKGLFLTRRYLGIVLEYANLGDLFHYVTSRTRLTEDQARWFFQQLMISVDYLHRRMEIAHRDIKLENILLSGASTQPILKLCDFGYAKDFNHHSVANTTVGTPTYMAPEVLLQKQYDGKLADVWSCGVVLYTMLAGRYPFILPGEASLPSLERQKLLLQRMLTAQIEPLPDIELSDDCRDLLRQMLQRDPAQRLSSWQVLEHPWFQVNLPQGVLSMNDRMSVMEAARGTEEMRAILDAARSVDTSPAAVGDGSELCASYSLDGPWHAPTT